MGPRARSISLSTGCRRSRSSRPEPPILSRHGLASRPRSTISSDAYDDAVDGRFSREPYVDIGFPSAIDPSVAPPGQARHGLLRAVRAVRAGRLTWDEQREALGDTVQADDREVRARSSRRNPASPGAHAAGYRADVRPVRGQHHAGRALLEQLFAGRPLSGSRAIGRRSVTCGCAAPRPTQAA